MLNEGNQEKLLDSAFASEDERQEVLQEIERLTSDAQTRAKSITPSALKSIPKGVWFPLLINLTSIGLFAVGLFGAQWYFGQRQQEIQVRTQQEFSPEGRLVAKLLEESQRRLREQQEQISKIQSEFERLSEERDNLANQFDQQLREREERLRRDLEERLAAERQRLQQQGLSQEEINRRLRDFENRQNAELERSLQQAREEAQREIQAREARIASLNSALEQARNQAEETRRQIENQSQGRIENLQTQLSEQAAFLERLSQERERELNLFRQIETGMEEVRRALATSTAAALERLDVVDGLVNANLANASENLARRLRAFQVSSSVIREGLSKLSVREVVQRVEADPRYLNFVNLVKQAREEPNRRAELWEEAVNLLEEVSETTRGLRSLDEERRTQERLRREQTRLNLVRQTFQRFDPQDQDSWQRLYEAIAPADAAQYEVELRANLQQVLNQVQDLARSSNQANVSQLQNQIEQLRSLNQTLAQRSESAENKVKELENLVNDLQKQIAEMTLASGQQSDLVAKLNQAQQEISQLQKELEELKKSQQSPAAPSDDINETLAKLDAEKKELLRQIATLSEDLTKAQREKATGDAELNSLRQYRANVERLRQAFSANLNSVVRDLSNVKTQDELEQLKKRFVQSITEADQPGLMNNTGQLLDALTAGQARLLAKPEEVTQARIKAFADVLNLTNYLKGTSGRGDSLNAELRNLSLRDTNFANVVRSIQELTVRGADERPIRLETWRPIGSVVSAIGEQLNVEILVSPETVTVGLKVQVRRAGNNDQTLAEGVVASVSGRRAVVNVQSRVEGQRLPIGGDIIYLMVP
jgi:hypothetical protein